MVTQMMYTVPYLHFRVKETTEFENTETNWMSELMGVCACVCVCWAQVGGNQMTESIKYT